MTHPAYAALAASFADDADDQFRQELEILRPALEALPSDREYRVLDENNTYPMPEPEATGPQSDWETQNGYGGHHPVRGGLCIWLGGCPALSAFTMLVREQ